MYKEILDVKGEIKHVSTNPTADFPLPPSYRQYAKELGYGLLCNQFIIYIPFDEPDSEHPDALAIQNEVIKDTFEDYLDSGIQLFEDEKNVELIRAAEPFGISENGHFLFWDTREQDENGEYPIYLANFPVGLFPAGNNLREFIEKVTNVDTVRSVLKFSAQPLPKTFEPYPEIMY
ncbi:SMI1/KNR4 family protein [Nostoc ellipsosporum NOK]|nr:SMI1/KNR4 family protein [Nostoc ellipsosporum NOK]